MNLAFVSLNFQNLYSSHSFLRNSVLEALVKHKLPQRSSDDLKSVVSKWNIFKSAWKLLGKVGNVFVRIPIFLKPTANRPSAVLLTKANTTWRVQLCMSDTRHLCTDLQAIKGRGKFVAGERLQCTLANTNSLPSQQTWCLCQKSLSVPFLILPSFIHEDGGGVVLLELDSHLQLDL